MWSKFRQRICLISVIFLLCAQGVEAQEVGLKYRQTPAKAHLAAPQNWSNAGIYEGILSTRMIQTVQDTADTNLAKKGPKKKRSSLRLWLGWLQKLSGPGPFIRGKIKYPLTEKLYIAATYSHSLKNDLIYNDRILKDSNVKIISIQPYYELFSIYSLQFEIGVGYNVFYGKAFNRFDRFSGNAQLTIGLWIFRVGGAANLFKTFSPEEFGAISENGDDKEFEVVWEWIASIGF